MVNFIKDILNLKETETEKSSIKSDKHEELSTIRYKEKNGNMIRRKKYDPSLKELIKMNIKDV